MPKADLIKIYEAYRQGNIINVVQEGMKVVEAPASEGDASAANMGPGGVIEVQPDGQYPDPPAKDENAEEGGGPREGEDWRTHMTRNIVAKGSDFLRAVYELGYTGEASDADINEVVELLAQEAEADERLKQALDAVVTHMVNAGHADS